MAKDEKNKLLIVEDDKGLQKQLKWCFADYELSFADNRESAIAQLRRNEPAVVLQDLGLPPDAEGVSEGIATLEEILTLSPETKVIVVTGNDDIENAVRSVGLGAMIFTANRSIPRCSSCWSNGHFRCGISRRRIGAC